MTLLLHPLLSPFPCPCCRSRLRLLLLRWRRWECRRRRQRLRLLLLLRSCPGAMVVCKRTDGPLAPEATPRLVTHRCRRLRVLHLDPEGGDPPPLPGSALSGGSSLLTRAWGFFTFYLCLSPDVFGLQCAERLARLHSWPASASALNVFKVGVTMEFLVLRAGAA